MRTCSCALVRAADSIVLQSIVCGHVRFGGGRQDAGGQDEGSRLPACLHDGVPDKEVGSYPMHLGRRSAAARDHLEPATNMTAVFHAPSPS
jgi:hypothetical protein